MSVNWSLLVITATCILCPVYSNDLPSNHSAGIDERSLQTNEGLIRTGEEPIQTDEEPLRTDEEHVPVSEGDTVAAAHPQEGVPECQHPRSSPAVSGSLPEGEELPCREANHEEPSNASEQLSAVSGEGNAESTSSTTVVSNTIATTTTESVVIRHPDDLKEIGPNSEDSGEKPNGEGKDPKNEGSANSTTLAAHVPTQHAVISNENTIAAHTTYRRTEVMTTSHPDFLSIPPLVLNLSDTTVAHVSPSGDHTMQPTIITAGMVDSLTTVQPTNASEGSPNGTTLMPTKEPKEPNVIIVTDETKATSKSSTPTGEANSSVTTAATVSVTLTVTATTVPATLTTSSTFDNLSQLPSLAPNSTVTTQAKPTKVKPTNEALKTLSSAATTQKGATTPPLATMASAAAAKSSSPSTVAPTAPSKTDPPTESTSKGGSSKTLFSIEARVRMTTEQFCCAADDFRATMADALQAETNVSVSSSQIKIIDIDQLCPSFHHCPEEQYGGQIEAAPGRQSRASEGTAADGDYDVAVPSSFPIIRFYVSEAGKDDPDEELTKTCYKSLQNPAGQAVVARSPSFKDKIEGFAYRTDLEGAAPALNNDDGSTLSVAIVIGLAGVAGACLVILTLLQFVVMRRRKGRNMRALPALQRSTDAHSLNSFRSSIDALRRSLRRSYRRSPESLRSLAYINVAMQTDKDMMSNPMSFSKLASRSLEVDYLEEEFKSIPTNLPKMSQLQQGSANKNRFANIIPLEETRVKLKTAASDYINANYVRGYRGRTQAYIATQSPMRNTVVDFWRMVWEQQSQVVVALVNCLEEGQPRNAEYLPDASGLGNVKVYGEFQVTAQKQVATQHYLFCVVTIKNIESSLVRQIVHFQYTAWPQKGVPESSANVAKFVSVLRPYMEVSQGPTIMHCSTGTGRTGTLLAIDIGMHAYDDSKTIDVMHLVFRLRKDRAGAVQTKEQYAFVYKTLLEYASECASSCSATSSSQWSSRRSSFHECQNEV